MHHYGDNVIGSIYMRFSGNVPTLTPTAGEENSTRSKVVSLRVVSLHNEFISLS